MKLFRFGSKGAETPGVALADGSLVDASAFGEDWNEGFFERDGLARLAKWEAASAAKAPRVAAGTRLGPAVARPSKVVCIGLNYHGHAKETNAAIPAEPIVFQKASSAWHAANDDLVLPRGSVKTDWEVELAVVIGATARYVSEGQALEHVAGFLLHNDYSEREYQLERGGQWDKGKGCDTFAPLGPWLVTTDEVGADASGLDMWLTVNDVPRQQSSTDQMAFGVAELVSRISGYMTLLPGDVISTGTPGGVALSMDPPPYLEEGDIVRLGITGLGESTQRVRAPR